MSSYCVNQEINFLDLPQDIIHNEIFKNLINNNDIEKSIKQVVALASVNNIFQKWFFPYYNKSNKFLYYTNTLVATAIEKKWDKLAEFIITNLQLTQDQKDEALIWAFINNDSHFMNRLLNNGADKEKLRIFSEVVVNEQEFLKAAEAGNVVVVKYLLVNKINVNTKDAQAETALMKASVKGHANIVKLLLDSGADTSIQNGIGYTALMKASYKGQEKIVKLLLKHNNKIDSINYQNLHGQTALILASTMGYYNIVKLLLEYKADSNIKDNEGTSALNEAIQFNYKNIIKLLEK